MKINKKFDDLWEEEYRAKLEYMGIVQKIVETSTEKKKPRFDFSMKNNLEKNEDIIMMISTENLKLMDKLLEKEIITMIETRMEQTYYEFPSKFIEDGMWRRFSKYVGFAHLE